MTLIYFVIKVFNVLESVINKIINVGYLTYKSIQPQIYIFFENNIHTYNILDVKNKGDAISKIEWYYIKDNKLFTKNLNDNFSMKNHISWLSATINLNDKVLYDLSDYINDLHYIGDEKPSFKLVISAWSLDSGIVLDNTLDLKIEIIDNNGDMSELKF